MEVVAHRVFDMHATHTYTVPLPSSPRLIS